MPGLAGPASSLLDALRSSLLLDWAIWPPMFREDCTSCSQHKSERQGDEPHRLEGKDPCATGGIAIHDPHRGNDEEPRESDNHATCFQPEANPVAIHLPTHHEVW